MHPSLETLRQLGTTLPADHKALVETYGPGAFDDFVSVLQPGCANPFLELVTQRDERLDAPARDGEDAYPLGALLPWASTDNGNLLRWITDSAAEPDEWPVTVAEGRGTAVGRARGDGVGVPPASAPPSVTPP